MGLYWNIVFPRLCDWVMSAPHLAKLRKQVLESVSGSVLEIGVGTGLNLPHYPMHVRRITTIDPNRGMGKLLQKRIAQVGLEVDNGIAIAEQLPFEEATFDCAISTWTLCSIRDAGRAINELYRVLKPGGRFLFLEHGLSDLPGVRNWQRRLNWLQQRLGGCRLDLNVTELFIRTPFRSVEIDEFYLEKTPKTHGYMYRGAATK